MVFVGPSPESITQMGLKHRAREVAQAANVPVIAGTGLVASAEEALAAAELLKYPVKLLYTRGSHIGLDQDGALIFLDVGYAQSNGWWRWDGSSYL